MNILCDDVILNIIYFLTNSDITNFYQIDKNIFNFFIYRFNWKQYFTKNIVFKNKSIKKK